MTNYFTYYLNASNSPRATEAGRMLDALLAEENPTLSYSRIMRYRIQGKATPETEDTYFIATDADRCVARLWHGWGNHPDSVGNFGNFKTAEDHQRQGIGGQLLELWFSDLCRRPQKPLALFCTCYAPNLVKRYGTYGFRPALEGTAGGPLYCPLGQSPATFTEFCQQYYAPTTRLHFLPGTVGYRHEIDCLLSFVMQGLGKTHALPSMNLYEEAILRLAENPACGTLERIAIDNGHTVGWAWTPAGGPREVLVHPNYQAPL